MPWNPNIPTGPVQWMAFYREVVDRINAIEPKQGKGGVVVTDATGGGRMIDLAAEGDSGVPLKDCVFYDTVEEKFFFTDVLTTGKKKLIEPPP